MATVFSEDGGYVVKWKDGAGQWRKKRTSCATKAEAKKLAADLERQADRQQLGLEARPSASRFHTFAELLDWWVDDYGQRLRSQTMALSVDKHIRSTLGSLPLVEVSAARIEEVLAARAGQLAPATLNHLRAFIHTVFARAIARELWHGANPAAAVPRRKVPRRLPEYLRAEEVPRVLEALAPRWRPLFATALYTGARQGELLGLRKRDADLDAGSIAITRSYDGPTTKGSRAALVPIAEGLRPYLVAALQAAKGELLFPRPDGSMQKTDARFDHVLRRAMGRAGIVEGYEHVCRRCKAKNPKGYRPPSFDDQELRRCDACRMKLWPRPLPRHVRFHDVRHTTATLLLKAGVGLATVQRILRHSDPAITSEVYGHLDLEDMRAAVNRLPFQPPEPLTPPVQFRAAASAETEPLGPPVVRNVGERKNESPGPLDFSKQTGAFIVSGRQDSNLRPLGPEGPPAPSDRVAPRGIGSQGFDITALGMGVLSRPLAPVGTVATPHGPPVVRTPVRPALAVPGSHPMAGNWNRLRRARGDLLSVAEVAERLRISTATVYKLIERGEVAHIRVSNAIRFSRADLEQFLEKGRR